MRSITAVISGKTKDGEENFSESFTYNEPTTIEECATFVGGDVVKFVAEQTSRMRENGVKNGLINSKKGVDLTERFASLSKTYGDNWVWSPRGEGIKALVAKLSAAQAAGDTAALASIVADLSAKYGAEE